MLEIVGIVVLVLAGTYVVTRTYKNNSEEIKVFDDFESAVDYILGHDLESK